MARNWCSIFKALIVRCILTCHVILCTWRVVVDLKNQMYWLLICGLVPLTCESCYTIIRRQGVEFSRFTPCFFFYLVAVIPGIWLLELDKTDLYIEGKHYQLSLANNSSEEQVLLVFSLSPKTWVLVIEEMLPYVVFISRWILPRGRVKREELAELLFAFIEISADIMEFFSLFGEDVIRSNKTLAYCVLSIWSLAVLQFTMTVTVIHQPKKEKKVQAVVVESKKETEWKRIQRECYAIFLTIVMQDLPFAIMRLYTIINFNYVNYSLIFFTSKNLIIISLLLYKVAALCKKRHCPDPEDGVENAEEIRIGTELDIAEIGQCKNNGSFGGLTNHSINSEKPDITQDESYMEHNHCLQGVETELKKRCLKSVVSSSESTDSGRVSPQIINSSRHDSEPVATTELAYHKTKDISENSPEFCIICPRRHGSGAIHSQNVRARCYRCLDMHSKSVFHGCRR